VDTIPTLAWSARPDGSADFFNQRWLDYTGLAAEQALDWGWQIAIHPDDLRRMMAGFEEALKLARPFEAEGRFRSSDGEFRWFLFRASPLRDESGKVVKWYGTNTDIEDRKRAEEALRSNEQNLRLIVDSIPGLVVTTTPVGEIELLNRQVLEYFGKTAEELSHWKTSDAIHPDDVPGVVAALTRSIETGEAYEVEHRLRRADGVYRWFHARGLALRDKEGGIVRWYYLITDVDDRKRAEEALKQSEVKLRLIVDSIPAFVMIWTADHQLEFVNRRLLEYTGKAAEELTRWPTSDLVRDLVHPDDVANLLAARQLTLETGHQQSLEYRVREADGAYRWFHGRRLPQRDAQGRIVRWFALLTDIEERKQAEDKLRRSEAYLANAQSLTRTGTWAINPSDLELIYWSREYYRIYGLDPAKDRPSRSEVLERIHPDDRAKVDRTLKEAILHKTGFDVQFRLVLPDGTEKRIHSVARPVIDEADNVVEMVGTSMDVTDEYEARTALQTAFEQIKAEQAELRRMTDAVAAYIYVLRPDGTALYANQTVLDYIGLTLQDVQRENHRARVFHPEDVERLREERREALARGKPFELEQRALGRDGNYRWFLVRYNPLHDDQGHIIRWYATGTDIEDRKQAEDRIRNENLALREQIDQAFMFEEIVGASPVLQSVLSSVVKVAPTDSTVLITGETGTGKELIARAVHKRSQRAGRAFVSVNCAALAPTLISSELFGHEKGAFTGASQRRLGRFELADGGTIFLDEVGDLPPDTQVALLRVLQERQFERVGGSQSIRVNVRVIAATNRNLESAVAEGTFRSDLFYRLNVFPINIPPLRERREDIPLLVEYFIDRFARKAGKKIRGINKKTLDRLVSYPWPGNIRELQNVVERSVIVCDTGYFSIDEGWLLQQPPASDPKSRIELSEKLAAQEKEMIEAALHETEGRVSGPLGAAARLGIHRSTLESKISSLKIDKYRFKSGSLSKRKQT
jgi:PAS domain S-box-containing protein